MAFGEQEHLLFEKLRRAGTAQVKAREYRDKIERYEYGRVLGGRKGCESRTLEEMENVASFLEEAVALIKGGVNLMARKNENKGFPLFAYAARFDKEFFQFCLDQVQGENIDEPNDDGKTALLYTAWLGTGDNAKLLIDAGADIERKIIDSDGTAISLLESAIDAHNPGTVKSFLDAGVQFENDRIHNLLKDACLNACDWQAYKVLEPLLYAGFDLGHKDEEGDTLEEFLTVFMYNRGGYGTPSEVLSNIGGARHIIDEFKKKQKPANPAPQGKPSLKL